MPNFPGFFPVTKHCQAGTVTGGMHERKGPLTPSSTKDLKNGRRPCSIQGRSRVNVAPSNPITTTFDAFSPPVRRPPPPPPTSLHSPQPPVATQRSDLND